MPRFGDKSMFKTFALIGFGAAIALMPLSASAQTSAAPGASTTHHVTAHTPTGSHRSEMRRRHNSSKDRARAGAEHVRSMRQQ